MISGLGLGGAERQVVALSKQMVRQGHAASVYTLNRETSRANELADSGVEVVMDQKSRRLDLGVVRRIRNHIRRWRPDLVHGFLYDGDIYSRLAGFGMRIPVLNSERSDGYALSRLQWLGYRLTSGFCNGIVANSHAGADFARRLHRASEDEVHVVWNGIDLEEIDTRLSRSDHPAQRLFLGQGIKRLCIVGSINPAKDYPLALRVVRCLVANDPSWRLICVGDELPNMYPGYKSHVLTELRRLQLENLVSFVGLRRDVPEIMASSDLLLVTSRNEGFPNVVLEAMACGTAVVSTEYSDVRRILPFAEQVVGSRDELEIAQAIVRCYENRAELAKAQRHWVEMHATVAKSMAALIAVYQRYVPSVCAPYLGARF